MNAPKHIRDVVISKVCHDIRNPLTSIVNSLDILSEARADSETFEKFKNLMRLSAETISVALKNLSLFSMIERGEFQMSPNPADIGKVLADSIKMNKVAFDIKWIEFNLDAPAGLPQASVDTQLLKQAFDNIFSFLMKFMMSKDKLDVKLYRENEKVFVRITAGAKAIPQDYLLSAFSEIKLSSEEASQGAWTGFGLYISKRIMQEHNGDLSIESSSDGAAFVVSLPEAHDG